MKDEIFGIIMMKFFELKAKTYSYLIDIGSDNKKAKGTKKCVTERKLKIYLWPSKKMLDWKLFKNDKQCFVFPLKSSFCSQDTYIFIMTFLVM